MMYLRLFILIADVKYIWNIISNCNTNTSKQIQNHKKIIVHCYTHEIRAHEWSYKTIFISGMKLFINLK